MTYYPRIWTRYPKYNELRDIVHNLGIGAVVATTWSGHVYPTGDYDNPDFTKLDAKLATLPDGYSNLHAHPIIAKGSNALWNEQKGQLEKICFNILDRYADRIPRWTIAAEVLVKRNFDIVRLYEAIAAKHSKIELWVCDYGIKSYAQAMGIVDILPFLQAIEQFKGIVLVNYLDLRSNAVATQASQKFETFIPLGPDWKEGFPTETLADWLAILNNRIGGDFLQAIKIAGLDQLDRNIGLVANTGVNIALETGVITGMEPTKKEIARCIYAYKTLMAICQKHNAEMWQWNMFDRNVSLPWLGISEDCGGWFDMNDRPKEWCSDWLGAVV